MCVCVSVCVRAHTRAHMQRRRTCGTWSRRAGGQELGAVTGTPGQNGVDEAEEVTARLFIHERENPVLRFVGVKREVRERGRERVRERARFPNTEGMLFSRSSYLFEGVDGNWT